MLDISDVFSKIDPTYAVNAAIEVYGAVATILAIVTVVVMRLDKKVARYVVCAYVFTFLSLTGDAVASILRGQPGQGMRIVLYISNFLGMAGISLSGYFYLNVLFSAFSAQNKSITRAFRYFSTVLVSISIILLIVTQWTGWLYKIDENNLYVRGNLFWLNGVYGASLLTSAASYYALVSPRMKKSELFIVAICIVIPLVGVVTQTLIYGFVFMQTSMLILMFIILFHSLMRHTGRMVEQQQELAEKEISLEKMRESMLISQVRPHFIYNSLTAIQRIEGNPPETIKAIDDFSKYLRQNLSVAEGATTVPFEKEIEHIHTYVDIEKLRFGNELNVEFDIQDIDFQVPILSVQILVENAIKHGVMKKRGGGTVRISSYKEDDNHVIEISDDGVGFDEKSVPETGHIGIRSTRERLAYYVHGDLVIDSEKGKGTVGKIIIPAEG